MATNAASLATLGNSFIIQFHGGCSLGRYRNEADLSDLGLMFDVRFVLGFGSSMRFQGSSLGKFRYWLCSRYFSIRTRPLYHESTDNICFSQPNHSTI